MSLTTTPFLHYDEEPVPMTSPNADAVRVYADEWSQRLLDEVRAIGLVRDVLVNDRSGSVTRILRDMLALTFRHGFVVASALHQEQAPEERDWADELLGEERSSPPQVAAHGPAPLSSAPTARPRPTVQQAVDRLRELLAYGDGNGPRPD
jgi:hypothetical protein